MMQKKTFDLKINQNKINKISAYAVISKLGLQKSSQNIAKIVC